MASRGNLRPSAVLATYVETLVEGRRVVIFGDATSGLAELLVDRGARIVHVYDPDPTRVAEATARNTSRSISHAPLPPSGLAARDGAFELGIVDDLNSAGPAHSIVNRMRRALGPRGIALVAIPNPNVKQQLLTVSLPSEGALDYYELYDTLMGEFSHVRMLGQAPFVGYAVVDFAAGSPDPSLDTSLVPGGAEEPEWFIGVASDAAMSLDEFSVVQLALADAWPAPSTQSRPEPRSDTRSERIIARLQAEAERLRQEVDASKEADAHVVSLQRKLSDQDGWIRELESRASVADERADDAQTELDALRNAEPLPAPEAPPVDDRRLTELEDEVSRLQSALEAAEAASREYGTQLDAANADLGVASTTIEELKAARKHEQTGADSGETDVVRLEQQLGERGQEVRRLQRDLTTVERLGRELLLDLEERGQDGGPDAEALKAQLNALARANAVREADLEAARWTIAALEGQLSGTGVSVAVELQEARAELSRQANLIAQLRAHGSA